LPGWNHQSPTEDVKPDPWKELEGLSPRVMNTLLANDYWSREAVRRLFAAGNPRIPGLGTKGIYEIKRWLETPPKPTLTFPVERSYLVYYWDCGTSNHRHKTKELAEQCMDNQRLRQKAAGGLDREWLLARHRAGESMRSLAREMNRSTARIGQLIRKAMRDEERK
jgi:hypothetical protein